MSFRLVAVLTFSFLGIAVDAQQEHAVKEAIEYLEYRGKYQLRDANGSPTNASMDPIAREVITRYNPLVKEGLYQIIEYDEYRDHWRNAFHSIGIIGSLEPIEGDLERLKNSIAYLEKRLKSGELPIKGSMRWLSGGYIAVSRFGWDESREFFERRMSAEFWEDAMPEWNIAPIGEPDHIITAQSLAIANANANGFSEANEYIRSLLDMTAYSESEILLSAIRTGLDAFDRRREMNEANRAFYFEFLRDEDIQSGQSKDNVESVSKSRRVPGS